MNYYAMTMSVRCEDRSSVCLGDAIICPKPRRFESHRWQLSNQDLKAGNDLLDIIHSKGGYGLEQSCTNVASSPPLFCGSPPSRVANPLIHDARFGEDTIPTPPLSQLSPNPPPSGLSSSSPSSSARKGGCVRANFGSKPAVRIEGFDCLDRDRRNCSIPTLA